MVKYRINKSVTLFFDETGFFQENVYINNIINVKVGGKKPHMLINLKVIDLTNTYLVAKQLDTRKELFIRYDDIKSLTKNN